MKKNYLGIVALLAMAGTAMAGDLLSFAERVSRAKEIEPQESAQQYFKEQMYPAAGPSMSAAMRTCTAIPNASTAAFAVVADVTQEGTFSQVDYEPKTNTAECFAKALASLRVPAPPTCNYGALPVVIEMTITE